MSKMWITVMLALAMTQVEGFSLFPRTRITLKVPVEVGPRYRRSQMYYSTHSNPYSQPSYNSQSFSSLFHTNYNNLHNTLPMNSQYLPSMGASHSQYYSGGYRSPITGHQHHNSNIQGYKQNNQAFAGRYNSQHRQQYYAQPSHQIEDMTSKGWSNQYLSQYQPLTSQYSSQQSTYQPAGSYNQQYDHSYQFLQHSSQYQAPQQSHYQAPQEGSQYQDAQQSHYQAPQQISQYQALQQSGQYQTAQGSNQHQVPQQSQYQAPQQGDHHNSEQFVHQSSEYGQQEDQSVQKPSDQLTTIQTPPPVPSGYESQYNSQLQSQDYSPQREGPDDSHDLSYQPYNDNVEIHGTAVPAPITLDGNSVLQPYSQPQTDGGLSSSTYEKVNGQTTLVSKHVYFHVPPPDIEEPAPAPPPPPPPPTKNIKIIFIKAPVQETPNYAEQIQQQLRSQVPDEEKTLIYVLVKKPDAPEEPPPPPPQVLHKPEVFFIKYKTQKGGEYPQEQITEEHQHY